MEPKEFLESFLEFENENEMFTIRLNNVYIWHYIRRNIYFELIKILGISNERMEMSKKNSHAKFIWRDVLRNLIICNQFLAYHRDILIIPHERKYKEGKYYKCIYTSLIDENLSNSHYVLDKKSMESVYAIQKSHNILHFDMESFIRWKRIKIPYEVVSKMKFDRLVIEPIENYYKINFDLKYKRKLFDLVNSCLNNRKYLIKYYDYMLQKIVPQIILMVVSYDFDRMVLCEVAKKRKIPVVELQHGAIGCMHIAYQFYKEMKLPGFPDYIFTFGQFDKNKTRFPVNKDKVIPVGFPELEKNYDRLKENRKTKKVILFISQGVEEIAKYANLAAQKLDAKKYQVIFKLHPCEYYDWQEKLGQYLKCPHLEVVGSYEHTVHEFLAKADWVIGNYSTVLYEAQMFDAKVMVLKFGLFVNVEDLYKYGYALLIESPEQMIQEIKENSFIPNKEVSVFEKNSLDKIEKNINEIIRKRKFKKE